MDESPACVRRHSKEKGRPGVRTKVGDVKIRVVRRASTFLAVVPALICAPSVTAAEHARRLAPATTTRSCSAVQLVFGGLGNGAAQGTGILTVRITNVTADKCTLDGRPRIRFFGPRAEPIVSHVGNIGVGRAFGTPRPVLLRPGGSGGFVITSRDLLQPSADCVPVAFIRVALSTKKAHATVTLPPVSGFELCGGATHPTNVSPIVGDSVLIGYAPEWVACNATQLTLSLRRQVAASGTEMFIALLRNHSSAPCTLSGYPKLRLATRTGRTVLRFKSGRSTGTLPPLPLPRPVSLGPHGAAQFVFAAADYDVVMNKLCRIATRLHVTLPDGSTVDRVHRFQLCGFGGIGPFTKPGIITRPILVNGTWQRGSSAG